MTGRICDSIFFQFISTNPNADKCKLNDINTYLNYFGGFSDFNFEKVLIKFMFTPSPFQLPSNLPREFLFSIGRKLLT